jgi:general secretion pathway protein G
MFKRIQKKQGFTLVEIMIVVGVVILLGALSINGLLRSRMTANEAAAIKSLRTLQAAMDSYRVMNPRFPEAERAISTLCDENPSYLDNSWLKEVRQGYRVIVKILDPDRDYYILWAMPEVDGVTGNRMFWLYSDTGQITEGGVGLGVTVGPQ